MEFWFSEFHTPDVKHSIRVNKQLYSRQSDYQRIDIFETPEFGRVLTLDGNVMLTERDEFIYDEMITHVPMSVHRSAKDILVIGAGDGGVQVAVCQIGVQPQPGHGRCHRCRHAGCGRIRVFVGVELDNISDFELFAGGIRLQRCEGFGKITAHGCFSPSGI